MSTLTCLHSGDKVAYSITDGMDVGVTLQLELDWGAEKSKVLSQLLSDHPEVFTTPDIAPSLLDDYQLNDSHWSWVTKAHYSQSNEYFWFYLLADKKVQSACIIKHPKSSKVDSSGIFYIDYLAVAYWNRSRPGYSRRFKNTGTILITHAIRYATEILGYRPGFSLHSLPSAEAYYRKLNMTDFGPDPAYHELRYFEASEAVARAIGSGA